MVIDRERKKKKEIKNTETVSMDNHMWIKTYKQTGRHWELLFIAASYS